MRTVIRVVVAVALVLLAVAAASPASAHTDLVSSTVADGTWSPGDGPIDLEFSTELVPGRSVVAVALADSAGDEVRRLPVRTFGNHLRVTLDDVPAGTLRLRYAVVGADGHRVADELTFEVASARGTPSDAGGAATGPAADSATTGIGTRLVVGGMLAALFVAAALTTANAVVTSRGRP